MQNKTFPNQLNGGDRIGIINFSLFCLGHERTDHDRKYLRSIQRNKPATMTIGSVIFSLLLLSMADDLSPLLLTQTSLELGLFFLKEQIQ